MRLCKNFRRVLIYMLLLPWPSGCQETFPGIKGGYQRNTGYTRHSFRGTFPNDQAVPSTAAGAVPATDIVPLKFPGFKDIVNRKETASVSHRPETASVSQRPEAAPLISMNKSPTRKVRFSELEHEPRIYLAAPSGVLVARLRAFHIDEPKANIMYKLYEDTVPESDAQYFQINTEGGNLTTKRYIDRPVGSIYEIVVVAYFNDETEYINLTIRVTEYNKFPPHFRTSNYRLDVDLITAPGKQIVTVHAIDNDVEPYNAEVYYSLQSRTSIISVNRTTGVIGLREHLSPRYRDLVFTIVAFDGGSPFRTARTKLTLTIKIISAPQDLAIEQTGDQWAMLCWLQPASGVPLGYIINLTTDFLQTTSTTRNISNEELGHRKEKLCTALTDLESWSNFDVRVAGWNTEETGMSSPAIRFNTKVNRTCYNLNNSEYKCTCLTGFYGVNCSLFNPCEGSVPPCLNGGICESTKNNEFKCTCPNGYDGTSCENFNPCSQASCQHGSTCYNTSATTYACKCLAGYTGMECETDVNECASDPCLNGGTCTDEVDAFYCHCRTGFKGETCEININECASNPCKNGAPCQDGEGEYTCQCLAGYTGKLCESDIDECLSNPCDNNGTCINNIAGYTCVCGPGYEGDYCEEEINECTSWPCSNGGTCVDEFNSFKCLCSAGFTGPTCNIDIDLCASSPCENGGNCIDKGDYVTCDCLPGFKGDLCNLRDQCKPETVSTTRGSFTWPVLDFGYTMVVECPYGITKNVTLLEIEAVSRTPLAPQHPRQEHFKWNENIFREKRGVNVWKVDGLEKDEFRHLTGDSKERHRLELEKRLQFSASNSGRAYAVRSCVLTTNGSVAWTQMRDGLCREEGFTAAEQLSQHLENLTKIPSQINADMFLQATKHIEQIVNYAITDRKIAQSMVSVLSNMLDVNGTIFDEADKDRTVSTGLMNTIETFTREVRLQPRSSISLSSPNLALEVITLRASDTDVYINGVSFVPNHSSAIKPHAAHDASLNHASSTEQTNDINIVVPREAILKIADEGVIRIQFVSFRTRKLFRAKDETKNEGSETDGKVIMATISNLSVADLTESVSYNVPNVYINRKQICVYWDPKRLAWKKNGIVTNQTDNWIHCESSHLTAFSVLLDPTPDASLKESLHSHHQATLSKISYAGATLSTIGLVFTILTYAMFRCLNRDRSGKILLNLCLSLLLMNVSYIVLSLKDEKYFEKYDICMVVALAIHYLVLSSLTWMLVEAVNMYQLLITVFASAESRFMLKRIMFAWGMPLFIVTATVGYTGFNYYKSKDPEICLFTPQDHNVYYVSFIGPACTILIINCVVFLRVSRVLCMKRTLGKHGAAHKGGITPAQVRGAFTVMTLLGVTWITGVFAVERVRIAFQYAFCVTNSLQGFIIFIVRCVQYPEARNAWATLFRTGHLKKHRGLVKTGGGPSSSHSQHTTSSSQPTRGTAKSESIMVRRESAQIENGTQEN